MRELSAKKCGSSMYMNKHARTNKDGTYKNYITIYVEEISRKVDLNKSRLKKEIDSLPIDTKYRERKLHDMTIRLDGLYDTIAELEERIEDAKLRKDAVAMEAATIDNIYKIMQNFNSLYDMINDEEKKNLVSYLIKEIQIYPEGESKSRLRSIEFKLPIYRDGIAVRKLLWESDNINKTD